MRRRSPRGGARPVCLWKARSSSTSAGSSRRRGSRSCSGRGASSPSPFPSTPLATRHRPPSSQSATARWRSRSTDAPNAKLLGPLPRERLPVAYAAADLLALPSIPTPRFREPWGLVCNEALHQGTPVVATTAVGAVAGGLIRDGETGLVVPPNDPAALAAAIDRLLVDPALRARLGQAGRAALAGHTYAAMADAFGVALARAGALR